jgi:hypothetical protein
MISFYEYDFQFHHCTVLRLKALNGYEKKKSTVSTARNWLNLLLDSS